MKTFVVAILCLGFASRVQAQNPMSLSISHDGRWSVSLVCADVKSKDMLVKGYEFAFPATIVGGRLQGQHGAVGAPTSLVLTGVVYADGALALNAEGHTGKSEFAVGRVAQGTRYAYTLTGTIGASAGQAIRTEQRPCTATLARQ